MCAVLHAVVAGVLGRVVATRGRADHPTVAQVWRGGSVAAAACMLWRAAARVVYLVTRSRPGLASARQAAAATPDALPAASSACRQALAAKMGELYEQWWLLVLQLEHAAATGRLSLAGLLYYCQAPAASLELLASIAVRPAWLAAWLPASCCWLAPPRPLSLSLSSSLSLSLIPSSHSCKPACTTASPLLSHVRAPPQGEAASAPHLSSAGLLNLLAARQRRLAGDAGAQALLGQLLEAAAAPYFDILRCWLVAGVLEDPHSEFMVKVRSMGMGGARVVLLVWPVLARLAVATHSNAPAGARAACACMVKVRGAHHACSHCCCKL